MMSEMLKQKQKKKEISIKGINQKEKSDRN